MNTDSIISGLYGAANGRIDWETALRQVAHALDLWVVQVVGIDARSGKLLFSAHGGEGVNTQSALDYVRFFNTVDPRIAPSLATPPDQWMLSHEHHDDAFVASSSFYQDFLHPHGGGHMAGAKLLEAGHVQYLLACVRRRGEQPLGPAQMPFLAQLKHHLGEALRNEAHLRQSHAEMGVARAMLEQFSYPMLLMDDKRGIWQRNAPARQWLENADVVFEQEGHLLCRNSEDDLALTRAIMGLEISAPAAGSSRRRRGVTLHKPDGSACLAFVSAVRPHETMGAFGHLSGVLAVLHDPSATTASLDPFILGECFDFTPAEARIAAQIAAGAGVGEIALRSGTAQSTVRSHLKQAMEKAGVDRQADLIRVLLALPVRVD